MVNMKLILNPLLVVIIFASNVYSQHKGIYQCESDTTVFLIINDAELEISEVIEERLFENSVESFCLLKSPYVYDNNLIKFSYKGHNKTLELVTTDLIVLKDCIDYFIEGGSFFYCTKKVSEKGKVLYYGNWKEGKKNGYWLYFNDDETITKFLFQNDKIMSRETFPFRGPSNIDANPKTDSILKSVSE